VDCAFHDPVPLHRPECEFKQMHCHSFFTDFIGDIKRRQSAKRFVGKVGGIESTHASTREAEAQHEEGKTDVRFEAQDIGSKKI